MLVRPGKEGRDHGATLHVSRRVFYVFTSSSEFHQGRGYGPVAVYAILNHGGDFKAAARALVGKGYGEKRPPALQSGVTVFPQDDLVSEVLGLYRAPYYPGESTGWRELDSIFRIEKGQLNILFGIPSHGKSSFIDALAVNVATNSKWRILEFSPENKSRAYHASKLCEIKTGKPMYRDGRMTEEEVAAAAKWVADSFVFLSPKDAGTSLDEILEKVKEVKPDMVVVDPWNRLNHSRTEGMTETEYIGSMLAKTSALCKNMNLSFWFVVHPQKLRRDKEGKIIRPGFYEVSGSAHWANMADNGILVWRHFDAESPANDYTEIETVKVRYRHNGSAGTVKMKFDRPSGRFFPFGVAEKYSRKVDHKAAAAGEFT
jgi:twinkle protein